MIFLVFSLTSYTRPSERRSSNLYRRTLHQDRILQAAPLRPPPALQIEGVHAGIAGTQTDAACGSGAVGENIREKRIVQNGEAFRVQIYVGFDCGFLYFAGAGSKVLRGGFRGAGGRRGYGGGAFGRVQQGGLPLLPVLLRPATPAGGAAGGLFIAAAFRSEVFAGDPHVVSLEY